MAPVPELDVALLGEELTAALPALGEGGAALWHWQQLKSELKRWDASGYEIVACCAGEGELARFKEMLKEDASMQGVRLRLEHRELAMGLLFPTRRLALLSDQEIFGRDPVMVRRWLRSGLTNCCHPR